MKTTTTTTTTTINTIVSPEDNEDIAINELVEYAINSVIQEAIIHFSKLKRTIRNPEDDCRYFWNDKELSTFLKQVKYPDRVWVSTVNDHGKFYAYRVGRIVYNKKHGYVKC